MKVTPKVLSEKKKIFFNRKIIQDRFELLSQAISGIFKVQGLPYKDELAKAATALAAEDLTENIENYVAKAGESLFVSQEENCDDGISRAKVSQIVPCGSGIRKDYRQFAMDVEVNNMVLNEPVADYIHKHGVDFGVNGNPLIRPNVVRGVERVEPASRHINMDSDAPREESDIYFPPPVKTKASAKEKKSRKPQLPVRDVYPMGTRIESDQMKWLGMTDKEIKEQVKKDLHINLDNVFEAVEQARTKKNDTGKKSPRNSSGKSRKHRNPRKKLAKNKR